MTPPPLIDAAALGSQLGDAVDSDRAEWVIRAASTFVRSCCVDDWIAVDGTLEPVPPAVQQVTVQVAARSYQTAGTVGVSQETTGPFSTSYAASASLGDMFLTKSEKGMLKPWSASKTGLWSLGTTRDLDDIDLSGYRTVSGGGDPVPMYGPSELGPPI